MKPQAAIEVAGPRGLGYRHGQMRPSGDIPQKESFRHAALSLPHHHPRPQHGRRPRPVARHRHEGRATSASRSSRSSTRFTQFVPGHVHLKDLGQLVAREIEAAGGVAKEFNTIAVDDGIAMGHDGMLYSPALARADRRQRRVHGQRALRRRAGLHLQLRQDHARHADGRAAPQHPDRLRLRRADGGRQGRARTARSVALDLVDAMVAAADDTRHRRGRRRPIERSACPTCGSCSGMFTANSMNCLTEALGLVAARQRLDRSPPTPTASGSSCEAGRLIVELARRYYEQDDETRAAARDRHLRGVRERHGARHRHGRLDQHRAAPARRRPRGRASTSPWPTSTACRAAVPVPVQGRARRRRRTTWRTCTAPAASWPSSASCDRAGLLAPRRCRRSTPRRSARRSTRLGRRRDDSDRRSRELLPRRAGRRADAGRLQPGPPLRRARPRPRRRACIRDVEHAYSQGRRPGRALRQPRAATAAS